MSARISLSELNKVPRAGCVTVLVVVSAMDAHTVSVMPKSRAAAAANGMLHLRRFTVVDGSGTRVQVEAWGEQAKCFSLEVGECLLLRHAKLSRYAGVSSLSMHIDTEVVSFGAREALGDELKCDKSASGDEYFRALANYWLANGL